jgi:hypothetical protein
MCIAPLALTEHAEVVWMASLSKAPHALVVLSTVGNARVPLYALTALMDFILIITMSAQRAQLFAPNATAQPLALPVLLAPVIMALIASLAVAGIAPIAITKISAHSAILATSIITSTTPVFGALIMLPSIPSLPTEPSSSLVVVKDFMWMLSNEAVLNALMVAPVAIMLLIARDVPVMRTEMLLVDAVLVPQPLKTVLTATSKGLLSGVIAASKEKAL